MEINLMRKINFFTNQALMVFKNVRMNKKNVSNNKGMSRYCNSNIKQLEAKVLKKKDKHMKSRNQNQRKIRRLKMIHWSSLHWKSLNQQWIRVKMIISKRKLKKMKKTKKFFHSMWFLISILRRNILFTFLRIISKKSYPYTILIS